MEFPVALNMFAADRAGLAAMPLPERARGLNPTIDPYEYSFARPLRGRGVPVNRLSPQDRKLRRPLKFAGQVAGSTETTR